MGGDNQDQGAQDQLQTGADTTAGATTDAGAETPAPAAQPPQPAEEPSAAAAPSVAPDPALYGGAPSSLATASVEQDPAAAAADVAAAEAAQDAQLDQAIDAPPPAIRPLDSIGETFIALGEMSNLAELIAEAIPRQRRTTTTNHDLDVTLQRIALLAGEFRHAMVNLEAQLPASVRTVIDGFAAGRYRMGQ